MGDPLVTTAWLAEHLGDANVQLVDATWFMPTEDRTGAQSYAEGHIPGSVFFDIDAISDPASDLPHMLPSPEAFAEAAGALGLRREAEVVAYDAHGLFSAPRVWWTLRVMGFQRARVLDGGLKLWRAEGREVQTSPAKPIASRLGPQFHAELVRDLSAVAGVVHRHDAQIIDARPAGRFRGEAPEPRHGLRSGHMPGARNVPWSDLVQADGRLRPVAELKATFEGAGVDLGQPIITTCGSGVSASLLALALARLGREDVPVYDGSWSEWGGRADTPVATGG